MADATKSSDESFQGQRKWRRRAPWIVGIFVATLIGSTALLHSAAQPQSWFRNLTGLQLSLKEPDGIVRVGRREDFPTEDVYSSSQSDGAWIVRLPEDKLVAIHTFCTHDGCATNWIAKQSRFGCPCCGSKFKMDGNVSAGPAERPLERFKIYLDRGSVIVKRSDIFRGELNWQLPGASLSIGGK